MRERRVLSVSIENETSTLEESLIGSEVKVNCEFLPTVQVSVTHTLGTFRYMIVS